jgi:glycosyltransferase involved in cell wall biosynthesis
MTKTISVITPAFNEEGCVRELYTRLINVFDSEHEYNFELLIVENGSTDNTWNLILEGNSFDKRVKGIKLSRNFGMDGGLTAGLNSINSDACVLMTADLQDPPELIPEFIRKWEEGYQNIYGEVQVRQGTGIVRTLNSKLFYWIAGKMTANLIPSNASDFRLLDRKAYLAVRSMNERNRFVRGLAAWVGYKSIGVPFKRPPRHAGESKAGTKTVINLAAKGLLANSILPLRAITFLGVASSLGAVILFFVFLFRWLLVGVPFSGFGTVVSLVLLIFGVLSFMIGLVSEYVGLIYEEVKMRPNFLISEVLGEPSGSDGRF